MHAHEEISFVRLSVCQSGEKFVNLNIDSVTQLDSSIDIVTYVCVLHRKQSSSIPSAFPVVSYLTS